MFGFIRLFISLIILVAAGAAIVYFLPTELKIDAARALVDIAPDELKEKAESLLLSPDEQRAKLINELGNNLSQLKENPPTDDTAALIEQSELLLAELSEQNDALSITEILKTKLVDEFFATIATTTPECVYQ